MSKIIDRAGKGADISPAENDSNLESLHGVNQAVTGTTHTVDITDQGDTLEFTNIAAKAITLDLIATILGAAHTADYAVTLFNSGAGAGTITPNVLNSFNTGVSTIILETGEYVTLQTDSTGLIWNVINESNAYPHPVKDTNGNNILEFSSNVGAVNNLLMFNDSTGGPPGLQAIGEINTGLDLYDSNSKLMLRLASVASAANLVRITNATTGNAALIDVTELNGDLKLSGNGTGGVLTDSLSASTINGDLALSGNGTGGVLADSLSASTINGDLELSGNGTGRVIISDATLNAPILNLPAFRAESNAVQVMSGTQTKINFAVENFDKTSDYSTVNSRFTPSEAGIYLIHSSVYLSNTPPGTFNLWIYKNGAISRLKTDYITANLQSTEISVLLSMNGTTDYVEIFGQLGTISAASIGSTGRSVYFEAHRVSS